MSKKTLLNEATVRRFMKLANMQGLSDTFVNEYGMANKAHEDEEEAPEDMGPEDEMDMGEEPMADAPMDEPMADEPMDEPAGEEDMGDMDMGDDADEVEISEDDRDVLAQAAEILNKIAGGGGADMGDMDMDMADDAGKMDAPMMEEEAVEEGKHGEEEDTMEEAKHDEDEPMEEAASLDEDELVQEVTRRVAEKLRAAMKKQKKTNSFYESRAKMHGFFVDRI